MQLLTKELEARFAAVGSQADSLDPLVIAKFFTPWSNWTWYATEYDPANRVFYGFVEGFEAEWGSFALDELEQVTGPAGLRIERDLYFGERKIREAVPAAL